MAALGYVEVKTSKTTFTSSVKKKNSWSDIILHHIQSKDKLSVLKFKTLCKL